MAFCCVSRGTGNRPGRLSLVLLALVIALGLSASNLGAPKLQAAEEPETGAEANSQKPPTATRGSEAGEVPNPEGEKPAGEKVKQNAEKPPATEHPFPRRMEAPPLDGAVAWINTAGPIDLEDLRGKFVVLDFWTYCCINCMHVLPELKKLEQAYPNEVVVIGVHSAKFETEQDTDNIREAVLRYEIEHPVINDSNHAVWTDYMCRSWPSLRVIDPEGFLVAGNGGEIEFEALDAFFKRALPYYRERGLLDESPVRFDLERHRVEDTPLRFPGKILADEPSQRLFIADSNHNRIVIAGTDGSLIDTIGTGQIGASDGDFDTATFDHPQGMVLRDQTLYVADTENHLIRKVDLASGQVSTIAGVGTQGRNAWPGLERNALGTPTLPDRFVGPPRTTPINSPWALWIQGDDLFIAMAGPHQIWKMPLDESEIGPYAGNGREDIVDGALLPSEPYAEGFSSFAQPSGLTSDGTSLFVADSEGSSIRAVPLNGKGEVTTVIGTSHLGGGRLFTFGDVDGQGEEVRLQHALGVVYDDGVIYIADTYNNKIKKLEVASKTVSTVAGTGEAGLNDDTPMFDEPAGITLAAGKLYVADTNNHAIRVIDLADNNVSTLTITGLEPPAKPKTKPEPSFPNATQVEVDKVDVRPVDGSVSLAIELAVPEGYKLNPMAPMGYLVRASGNNGPVNSDALGKWTKLTEPKAAFNIRLPLEADSGEETLEVALTYYYCREGSEGLCKVGSVIWKVPVHIAEDATAKNIPLRFEIPGDEASDEAALELKLQ